MIDALQGIVTGNEQQTNDLTSTHIDAQHNIPVISYSIQGQATLLNSWEDPSYFTSAFPTLFPNSIGSHLDKREFPVSLKAFAN